MKKCFVQHTSEQCVLGYTRGPRARQESKTQYSYDQHLAACRAGMMFLHLKQSCQIIHHASDIQRDDTIC